MKKNRFIPYGYTMRNGKMVIEKTEAEVIRRIFSAYIEGASLREIADFLTAQQVPYTEKRRNGSRAESAEFLKTSVTAVMPNMIRSSTMRSLQKRVLPKVQDKLL